MLKTAISARDAKNKMKNINPDYNLRDFFIKSKEEPKMIEVECQNYGKKVMAPYYRCIFYDECIKGVSFETADAPEFKPRFFIGGHYETDLS